MLTIGLIYPELLGTYGDGGNALVLVERARRRGLNAEILSITIGDEIPTCAIYLLGGGEDGPQRLGADLLRRTSFASRVRDGSYVLAVCAGLQLLGSHFAVEGSDEYEGLNLVDASTRRSRERSVGELVVRDQGKVLVGFENHGGRTTLGAHVKPLGTVVRGRGNDGHVDGFHSATIWATYAHGPVLALNPWFADEILSTVSGKPLEELPSVADQLYEGRRTHLGV